MYKPTHGFIDSAGKFHPTPADAYKAEMQILAAKLAKMSTPAEVTSYLEENALPMLDLLAQAAPLQVDVFVTPPSESEKAVPPSKAYSPVKAVDCPVNGETHSWVRRYEAGADGNVLLGKVCADCGCAINKEGMFVRGVLNPVGPIHASDCKARALDDIRKCDCTASVDGMDQDEDEVHLKGCATYNDPPRECDCHA
ncbi:hypothetical protein [uncultured Sulfitobacter sp.]|uniref:hypothetical protein n=1 Tax=uncultured Sulfitobacter sp. TaxID=191468 RepID=UPI0025975D1C|nr:hypothetical protein [uncultured Sulfitobacter sp.]